MCCLFVELPASAADEPQTPKSTGIPSSASDSNANYSFTSNSAKCATTLAQQQHTVNNEMITISPLTSEPSADNKFPAVASINNSTGALTFTTTSNLYSAGCDSYTKASGDYKSDTFTTASSQYTTGSEMFSSSPNFTANLPSNILNDDVSFLLNGPITAGSGVKQESVTPPPPSITVPNTIDNNPQDLLDINDYMLGQDLNSMDWTSDQTFDLDLTDTTGMTGDHDMKFEVTSPRSMLGVPGSDVLVSQGSEPDIAALGLNDPDNANQMDVSDWLDVIMPNSTSGLTPLSSNAPVSFPSDPILTPKTQQEVLDLFSFEDNEFSNASELNCGLNWDKLTETTGSTG